MRSVDLRGRRPGARAAGWGGGGRQARVSVTWATVIGPWAHARRPPAGPRPAAETITGRWWTVPSGGRR